MANDFSLTFAGVPFILDTALTVRMPHSKYRGTGPIDQELIEKHQVLADLMDEVNRLIPLHYLNDFTLPTDYPGRNLGALARPNRIGPFPNPTVKVGDWYYPNGAQRWSVFRGLATSSQAKAMLAATQGSSQSGNLPQTLVMQQSPLSPNNPNNAVANYTVQSPMYLLPPRPLAEHGGRLDGLYLITLVDERYWWQYQPITYQANNYSDWGKAIQGVAGTLGIVLSYPPIASVYQNPEPDSPIWMNDENAAALMDALAANLGLTLVRNLNGSYRLISAVTSQSIVTTNRSTVANSLVSSYLDTSQVVRTAGGDIFNSGVGNHLPIGDLSASRNLIIPSTVQVSFPLYIFGPIPHFADFRVQAPESTKWYQESYGDVFNQYVPITSGGPLVSGLTGTPNTFHSIHTTAKALVSGEGDIIFASGQTIPNNQSGLNALAMQLATNYYNRQVAAALDEVYPGAFAWTPEGIHDIIWTYSARARQVVTRVMRTQWNNKTGELQHSTPAPIPQKFQGDGITPIAYYVPGADGPSIPQTWRDSYGSGTLLGTISTALAQTLASGDLQAVFNSVSYFPTQNRWKGSVDSETIFFEGTSGGLTQTISGVSQANVVNIVYRAIDGTFPGRHDPGTAVAQLLPNTSYGTKLVTWEKSQFMFPAEWTSGGIQGVHAVPQMQTVRIFHGTPVTLNSISHYSGAVCTYDTTQSTNPFIQQEPVWITEKNGEMLSSGSYYQGQFAGHSAAPAAPVYSTAALGSMNVIGTTGTQSVPLKVTSINKSPEGLFPAILLNYAVNIFTPSSTLIWAITTNENMLEVTDYTGILVGHGGTPARDIYCISDNLSVEDDQGGQLQVGLNDIGFAPYFTWTITAGRTGQALVKRDFEVWLDNVQKQVDVWKEIYTPACAWNITANAPGVVSIERLLTVNDDQGAHAATDVATITFAPYFTWNLAPGTCSTKVSRILFVNAFGPDIYSIQFNVLDFIVTGGDAVVNVQTRGYTGTVTDIYAVSFDSVQCLLTILSQVLTFQDGLLQGGPYN